MSCVKQLCSNFISTPYYRTLSDNSQGCSDEPDFLYSPYDLFCLESRLYPFIYKVVDRKAVIFFQGVIEKTRVDIKIVLKNITPVTILDAYPEDEIIELSKEVKDLIENKVSEIVSEDIGYCLIDRDELYRISRGSGTIGEVNKKYNKSVGYDERYNLIRTNLYESINLVKSKRYIDSVKKYPKSWFNLVLDYVNLDSSYNPFIKKEGIYLAINPLADFNQAYQDVINYILDTIDIFYQEGVIYARNIDKIAEEWGLERLDVEEPVPSLWKPVWTDKRFASNPVDFLQKILYGNNYIHINVSTNLVRRHFISKRLDGFNFLFEGSNVKVEVDGLDQAQRVAALVEKGEAEADGKVITYSGTRPSWMYLYIEIARENGLEESISYLTNSVSYPYTFSSIIDKRADGKTIMEFLREKVLDKLIRIQKENPGVSPHNIIEKQYQKKY